MVFFIIIWNKNDYCHNGNQLVWFTTKFWIWFRHKLVNISTVLKLLLIPVRWQRPVDSLVRDVSCQHHYILGPGDSKTGPYLKMDPNHNTCATRHSICNNYSRDTRLINLLEWLRWSKLVLLLSESSYLLAADY